MDPFGNYLKPIDSRDGIVSYVSKGEVSYAGGARAFGIASAPWNRSLAPEKNRIYEDKEYHVPVMWIGVLSEEDVVTPDEIRSLTGRKTPQRTLETPGEKYQDGMKQLAEVIIGRTVLSDLL